MLLDEERDHPGTVRIGDHGPDGSSDLPLLHRFCLERQRCGGACSRLGYGLLLRRAHLGWATEQYEIGCPARHYLQLGMEAVPLRNPELFQRYWRIRKMRYACKACRYYAGWF